MPRALPRPYTCQKSPLAEVNAGERNASQIVSKGKEAQVPESRWLAYVTSLPTDDPGARMRVLRTLESLG